MFKLNSLHKSGLLLVAVLLITSSIFACKTKKGDQAVSDDDFQDSVVAADSVSPAELEKFVNINANLGTIEGKIQGYVMSAVQEAGLSPDSFNQLAYEKYQGDSTKLTKEQNAALDKVSKTMKGHEKEIQDESKKIIKAGGLSPRVFQSIGLALNTRQDLQQQYREIMMKKMAAQAPQGMPGMPGMESAPPSEAAPSPSAPASPAPATP